jgi:hypothetical protein
MSSDETGYSDSFLKEAMKGIRGIYLVPCLAIHFGIR